MPQVRLIKARESLIVMTESVSSFLSLGPQSKKVVNISAFGQCNQSQTSRGSLYGEKGEIPPEPPHFKGALLLGKTP